MGSQQQSVICSLLLFVLEKRQDEGDAGGCDDGDGAGVSHGCRDRRHFTTRIHRGFTLAVPHQEVHGARRSLQPVRLRR